MSFIPKISRRYAAFTVFLTALSMLILPALSMAGHSRVAVLPWNVNGPADVSYLSGALTDMISSRVGSNEMVETVRKDLVMDAARKYDINNIGGAEAGKIGKALNADFIIYGSVSVLGDSISLDAKLLNVPSGEATPLYSTGIGISSIVKMARTISNDALGTP